MGRLRMRSSTESAGRPSSPLAAPFLSFKTWGLSRQPPEALMGRLRMRSSTESAGHPDSPPATPPWLVSSPGGSHGSLWRPSWGSSACEAPLSPPATQTAHWPPPL
eukprot:3178083-Alexandrium_andersonii.AAC.1